jgi:demethylmenaquinone methyltransferase/2-methoxy-6-polyprenyl-1,4-benzoquinol methylase
VETGIREMTRVATPGGRVVILEFSVPENGVLNWIYMAYFTRILPVIGRGISRARNDAYTYLPDSVVKFPKASQLCDIMRQCGLARIEATEMTFGIVTLYIGIKPDGED